MATISTALDFTASNLTELVLAPGTDDKARYSYALRNELRSVIAEIERMGSNGIYVANGDRHLADGDGLQEDAARIYTIVLSGALRLIGKDHTVAENRKIAADALDMCRALVPRTEWRRATVVSTESGSIKLIAPEDLIPKPGSDCFCWVDASDPICSAVVHDVL